MTSTATLTTRLSIWVFSADFEGRLIRRSARHGGVSAPGGRRYPRALGCRRRHKALHHAAKNASDRPAIHILSPQYRCGRHRMPSPFDRHLPNPSLQPGLGRGAVPHVAARRAVRRLERAIPLIKMAAVMRRGGDGKAHPREGQKEGAPDHGWAAFQAAIAARVMGPGSPSSGTPTIRCARFTSSTGFSASSTASLVSMTFARCLR